MTSQDVSKLELELYQAKQQLQKEQDQALVDKANARIQVLVDQQYWKQVWSSVSSYSCITCVNLWRIHSLKGGWWSSLCNDGGLRDAKFKVDGKVEHMMIPILPTLIMGDGEVDGKARGVYLLQDGPVAELTVKRMTKKEAKNCVPCYINHGDKLLVPMTVGVALESRSEDIEFYNDLVPSSEAEFKQGLTLIRDFAINAQAVFKTDLTKFMNAKS